MDKVFLPGSRLNWNIYYR